MDAETRAWCWPLVDAAAGLSEAATTPIISYEQGGPTQFGMGTFLQIATTKLLITAAHVVHEALEKEWPLGVLDAGHDDQPARAVPLAGFSQRTDENYDVAVVELGEETVKLLPNRQFLTLQNFDIRSIRQGGFCFFGFPRNLVGPIADDRGLLLVPFSYCASLYSGSSQTFLGYNPLHHILMERSEVGVSDRDGKPAAMLEELRGISGCPVFQAWRNDRSRLDQSPADVRIVGVFSGGYREAFIATRWPRVVDLLWSAFPKLRSMLILNGSVPNADAGPAVLM